MIRNVIITGIGGQGVSFMCTLLRRAVGRKFGRFSGYDNRGGAQRYGSVATVLRFSDDLAYTGPMSIDFPDGGAHWVVGLEASEPLHFNRKLSAGTLVVVDRFVVPPTNVRRKDEDYYDADALGRHYRAKGCTLVMRDFRALAKALTGKALDANLLTLGVLLRHSNGVLSPADFDGVATAEQGRILRCGWDLAQEEERDQA